MAQPITALSTLYSTSRHVGFSDSTEYALEGDTVDSP